MRSEFHIELCFIREQANPSTSFKQEIELQLKDLFAGIGDWYIEEKDQEGLDIVVAEVKGVNSFTNEPQALDYMKERGSEQFWEWLQGYHIFVELKHGVCSHCSG